MLVGPIRTWGGGRRWWWGPSGHWLGAGDAGGAHLDVGWVLDVALGPTWSWGDTMGRSLTGCHHVPPEHGTRTSPGRGPPGCLVVPSPAAGWVLTACHPWVPGINCEVNPDDCASDPCVHGVCQDGIGRYDCVCQPGFTGGCSAPSVPIGCSAGFGVASLLSGCHHGAVTHGKGLGAMSGASAPMGACLEGPWHPPASAWGCGVGCPRGVPLVGACGDYLLGCLCRLPTLGPRVDYLCWVPTLGAVLGACVG